jgi:hypothetical protein
MVLGHFVHMPDQDTPSLQQIAADRDWWLTDAGAHYRELAAWLRDLAGKCHLPNPQKELLSLARRYEMRAGCLERRAARQQSVRPGPRRYS